MHGKIDMLEIGRGTVAHEKMRACPHVVLITESGRAQGLRILDLQSAVSSDLSALALDNNLNAYHDSEPIGIRFYGQICRI